MVQILVIDDDENICLILEKLLLSAGYEVKTALNGKEGIRLCDEQSFDLVVTDIFMPEKDGLEIIFEIRKKYPDIKLVAVSGGDSRQYLDLLHVAEKLGADCILYKPLDDKKLIQVVRELTLLN